MDVVIPFALGLMSGGVLGWFGHVLAIKRAKVERRIDDESARVERCREMFAARVRYVVAWHEGTNHRELRGRREELERGNPSDTPEVLLAGTPAWVRYVDTERRMLAAARETHQTIPKADRVREIDRAAMAVHRELDDRRGRALK